MKGKFLGFRLKEAREIKNLTLSDIADYLKITKQAVSQYESDISQPNQNRIHELIKFLELPPQYFSKERPFLESQIGVPNFRKLPTATKSAREIVKIKALWFAEATYTLKNYINFPSLDLPNFNIPADVYGLKNHQLEEYANALRKHWDLGVGPIDNMVNLLENKGVFVSRFNFDKQLDAFSITIDQDAFVILGNVETTYFRSRLDAAHELGHLILHSRLNLEDLENPIIHALIEKQAFDFGSAFLLPHDTFRKEFLSLDIKYLIELKKRWNVSIQAMVMRAYSLGLISASQKNYFFRGFAPYRKKEPLDDEYSVENPTLFKRALTMLKNDKHQYVQDIFDELAYDDNTIVDLLGIDSEFFKAPKINFSDISIK
ncbi:PF06114 domain protein [Leptospira kirschneri str. 200803703]|uniref:XRE family transcriptional regulator n=1 Tax=Leptospira kirschneri TaxID=29507 RepID=UPI0002BEBC35|nr:XRE family transcriptional regulator [Leptospira kirschneri]EMO68682.1 PF06114 domain protein [Leptospira kirschneri str. 200803703]